MGSIVSPLTASTNRGIHEDRSLVLMFSINGVGEPLASLGCWESGLGSMDGLASGTSAGGQWMSSKEGAAQDSGR